MDHQTPNDDEDTGGALSDSLGAHTNYIVSKHAAEKRGGRRGEDGTDREPEGQGESEGGAANTGSSADEMGSGQWKAMARTAPVTHAVEDNRKYSQIETAKPPR